MLEDALSFPTTADDWVQTLLVGGVLSLLGILILPAIVVNGYLLRVIRTAAAERTAPSFTDWGDLLIDGLRLLVLEVVVGVVLLVPLSVVLGIAGFFGGVTGSRAVAGVVVLLGLLVIGVLVLLVGYLLPAAVANFAIEDSLAAAVDLRTVADGAFTGDYATAWLLALLVGVVGSLVGTALSVVVVGIFLLFYVQVVASYLIGRGFAAGRGVEGPAGGPVGDGTPTAGGPDGTRQAALGEGGDRGPDEGGERGAQGPGRSSGTTADDSRRVDAPVDAPDDATGDESGGEGDERADDDEKAMGGGNVDDPDERGADGSGGR
ncbi:MAG: DUF4013 domain-containing protein [Haloferacaceae archaeon]